jgi:nucleotide-binding universal stress UspA family protein
MFPPKPVIKTKEMKTILVPVGFSAASRNAAEYAVHISEKLDAKIILLHVYHMPAQVTRIPFVTAPETERHNEVMSDLKIFSQSIQRGGGLRICHVAKTGDITGGITEACKEYNAGMIIMGINGKGAMSKLFKGCTGME